MPDSIKNHQISVTIATVAIVLIFVSSFSFNVGQERAGFADNLLTMNEALASHVASDDRKWDSQNKINKEVLEKIESQGRDTGVIKNDIKWIKDKLGGNE